MDGEYVRNTGIDPPDSKNRSRGNSSQSRTMIDPVGSTAKVQLPYKMNSGLNVVQDG